MTINKRCEDVMVTWHAGMPIGASGMEASTSNDRYKDWKDQTLLFLVLRSGTGNRKIDTSKYDEAWQLQGHRSYGKNVEVLVTDNHVDNIYMVEIESSVNYFIQQCSFKYFITHNHSCKKSSQSPTKPPRSTTVFISCHASKNLISICDLSDRTSTLKIKPFSYKLCITRKANNRGRLLEKRLPVTTKALINRNYDCNSHYEKNHLQLEAFRKSEVEFMLKLWLVSFSEIVMKLVSELQSSEEFSLNILSAWLTHLKLLDMDLDKEKVQLSVNNRDIIKLKLVFTIKGYKCCDNNDQRFDYKCSHSEVEDHNFDWREFKYDETLYSISMYRMRPKISESFILFFYVFNFILISYFRENQLTFIYTICLCQTDFFYRDNSLSYNPFCCCKPQLRIVYLDAYRGGLTTCAKVNNSIAVAEKNYLYLYLIFLHFLFKTIIFRNTSYLSKLIAHNNNGLTLGYRGTGQHETLIIKRGCTQTVCGFLLHVCYKIQILLEILLNHKLKLSFTVLFNFISDLVCDWSISSQMFFNHLALILNSSETISNLLTGELLSSNNSTNTIKNNSNVISNGIYTINEPKKPVEMYHIVYLLFRVSYDMSYVNCHKNGRKKTICASINFPGSKLDFCAFVKTNNRKNKSNYFYETGYSIQQHTISTERSKSNYTNNDVTGKDDNSLPSKGRNGKHKIQESSLLQNLSSKTGFPLLFYYHCVNITFNERPEFRGLFPLTIKYIRREKTKERAIWEERDKYWLKFEETKHAIKRPRDSLEKRSKRRVKEHSKYGGTFLSIRLPLFLAVFCYLMAGGSASCPRLCSCKWKGGKQTVECINKGLTTIPSDIDPGTQVLDMTGNPLVIISREKFKIIGLTNLQRIYATRCKLVQLDDSAFRGLSNLVELDLSINELRVVPAATLQFLPSLMRLQLSFNPITHIKDGSFRGLAYLTSLELTGCAIHTLESLAFQGLDRLEWLKINDNNLTTVPPKMMLPKSLHGVDMHNNPWTCDCKLRQLRQWLVQYNVPSSIEPKCAGPMRLRNRIIKEVIPSDLACAPDMRPTSFFLDIIEGKNVSLECHVTAVPDAEVQWLFNGYPLENSTFAYEDATSLYVYEDKELDENKISYLRIETVTEAHSGIFQCVAENQAGRTISNFTLRVSLPPTKPAPSVPPMNHIVYIGSALISLVVLVIILFCILIIRCCRRRSKHVKNKSNPSIITREKQLSGDRPKSNNMPKYIQMGTPAPKINGILADTPPISVIENSPYRAEPVGSTHINPDIIADGPDDRPNNKTAKKKVSIVGVEEKDANGTIITRKLDDIIEESEDNFDPTYEKIQVRNGYENTQSLLSNHYATLTRQQIESGNKYPLTELPPVQVPQHNVRFYDQQGFAVDYVIPREQWQDGSGRMDHIIRYSSPVPSDQSPLYATIRRNREEIGVHSNLLHDQKYPEEYSLRECNPHFPAPDMRYQQNYGLVPTHKKICEGGNTFCECCQPTISNPTPSDYDSLVDPMGRMMGDGCSFDHLLTSCGGHCCYDEKTGQLFDNTLPENYRPLEENPPPPPEGYGDSEDEVDVAKSEEWGDCTLSPGTRVLYSPQEKQFNGAHIGEQQPIPVGITNV